MVNYKRDIDTTEFFHLYYFYKNFSILWDYLFDIII